MLGSSPLSPPFSPPLSTDFNRFLLLLRSSLLPGPPGFLIGRVLRASYRAPGPPSEINKYIQVLRHIEIHY